MAIIKFADHIVIDKSCSLSATKNAVFRFYVPDTFVSNEYAVLTFSADPAVQSKGLMCEVQINDYFIKNFIFDEGAERCLVKAFNPENILHRGTNSIEFRVLKGEGFVVISSIVLQIKLYASVVWQDV